MGIISWSRRKSPWIYHGVCASCNGCDLELFAALTPRYDVERLGIKLVPTPRHADVLIISGNQNRKVHERFMRIYEQTPEPKFVLAVGMCALSSSLFDGGYNIPVKIKDKIKVDMFIPGCPPRPQAIIDGITKLLKKVK